MTLLKTCPRKGREQHVPDSPLDDMENAEGTSYQLVRLVFRHSKTQISRTIGTSVAQRQTASDFALLKRQTDKKTDRDRRTDKQTYIKTHTDRRALGQKRGKTDKTETETRGRRQQTRIKRHDGRQGRWCNVVYNATHAAVMVGGWLCGGVVVWWCSCCMLFVLYVVCVVWCGCCVLCVCVCRALCVLCCVLCVLCVVCLVSLVCLFCVVSVVSVAASILLPWSGGDPSLKVAHTPRVPERLGATPQDSTGQDGARIVCSTFVFVAN